MNAVSLFVEIIQEHVPEDISQGSPLIGCRFLGNTNRGEIGEEFIRRYLKTHGIKTGNGNQNSKTDMRIRKDCFEIKTASLGVNRIFQFNCVRLNREYDYLLCLGVCSKEIRFDMWRKGMAAENRAGKLVRMAESQFVTYKLTKSLMIL